MLHLQRAIGNQAVLRLLEANSAAVKGHDSSTTAMARFGHDCIQIPGYASTPVKMQPKLIVHTPGDIYEQEADQVADQVVRMPEPPMQRACPCGGRCPTCQMEQPEQEPKRLQTTRVGSSGLERAAVPPIVHEVLCSPSQPLDSAVRGVMESRFGHDFSSVRVHTDQRAAQSAATVAAHAYTVGSDVVFGSGRYAPASRDGQRLLAHELAHVVQQASGTGSYAPHAPWRISDAGRALEREAADRVMLGGAPRSLSAAPKDVPGVGPLLQRDGDDTVPVTEVEIPTPPASQKDDPELRRPRLRTCSNEIVPVDCFALEYVPGPQLQNRNGINDQYVFNCTDEVCDDDDDHKADDSWIIVPQKSEFGCGDEVVICADGTRTTATVVDRRPEWKWYLSKGAALKLGHEARTQDGSRAAPFKGKVLANLDEAGAYQCCPRAGLLGIIERLFTVTDDILKSLWEKSLKSLDRP